MSDGRCLMSEGTNNAEKQTLNTQRPTSNAQ
jgi:hypothetical protein